MFRGEDGEVTVPQVADGLIVLSSTLRSSDVNLSRLVSRAEGPVLSIGDRIAGAANIGVNDEAAVFQSVAHLVKRHGCRRVAYIAGPEESVDSERRRSAYRIALAHFGLPCDLELVARGNFEASSGREAVMQLLTNGSFDAIVAANDLMAIGAIEGLSAAGIAVPESVKVVGFDGIEESPFACGGLTTVRQPVIEQGVAAADLMRSLLAGEEVEETPTLISASLLIRHTCGCGSHAERWRAPPSGVAPGVDSYEELALIDDALRETIRKQLAMKRLQRELARVAGRLLGVNDYRELASVLTCVVRLFDVRRFALCTYATEPRLARVVLESSGRDVLFYPQAEPQPLAQLLQCKLSRHDRLTSLFIEPLELADEHFGFLVIEGDLSFGAVQLELRSLIAAALSRLGMLGEIRRIYSRHRELKPAQPAQAVRPGALTEPAAAATPSASRSSRDSSRPAR
ncbi:MAG: substrate-binding domain-containing protein [Pseudomonadota bacterium]